MGEASRRGSRGERREQAIAKRAEHMATHRLTVEGTSIQDAPCHSVSIPVIQDPLPLPKKIGIIGHGSSRVNVALTLALMTDAFMAGIGPNGRKK